MHHAEHNHEHGETKKSEDCGLCDVCPQIPLFEKFKESLI